MPDPIQTPLDQENINEGRQKRITRLELEAQQRASGLGLPRPKSTLELAKPDAFDGFTASPPTPVDQTGVPSPDEPVGIRQTAQNPIDNLPSFGRGVVGALQDVREGTVKNVPVWLRPIVFPLVKAGQGALAGVEWSGNVATTVAPYAVEQVQHIMPGKQELERVISEKQTAGLSRADSVRSAWEDTNFELPFKIPFATTAFTPSGSIQLDFQDIIEAGFDPVELILTFGTGGFGSGTGVLGAITGKQTVAAGLKTAVGQSIGARFGKTVAGKTAGISRFAAEEARGGFSQTRQLGSDLSNPGELLDSARTNVSEILQPSKARDSRTEQVRNMAEPETLAPPPLPNEDVITLIDSKDWRFNSMLNKIPEWIRGKENTARYKLASGLGEATYDKVIKLADPSSVVGDSIPAKAGIMREMTVAQMTNRVGLGQSYIGRDIFDKVFNVDQFGRSRINNFKLTPEGKRQFQKAGKYSDAAIAKMEKEGFMMNDLLEFYLGDVIEQVERTAKGTFTGKKIKTDATRSRKNSWFTGATPDQQAAFDRFNKVTKDWLDLALDEGALEVAEGKIVGFKFGGEATQEFGDVRDLFHYAHREVISTDIVDKAGETIQVMKKRKNGEGFSTGRTNVEKARIFETSEEGARNGALYAHPMEALESLQISISRLIGDKRAVNYLRKNDVLITNKEAFERVYPNLMKNISIIRKAEKRVLANKRRLEKKIVVRKAKAPLVKGKQSALAAKTKEVTRRQSETTTSVRQTEEQMFKTVRAQLEYIDAEDTLKSAGKSDIGKARGKKNAKRNKYQENRRVFNSKNEEVNRAINREAAADRRLTTQKNRVLRFDEEMFGVTNDLEIATAEADLMAATRRRLETQKSEAMNRIVSSRDLQLKAFGETGEDIAQRSEAVTHFSNGPLSGSFAPESMADELTKSFGDNGKEILSKIEKVTGTARTLSAGSADIGWMGIQGSLLAVTHPRTFAKAAKKSLEAVLDVGKRDQYVRDELVDVIEFLQNTGDLGSSEFFTSIDKTGMLSSVTNWLTVKEGKAPMWVPGVGGRKVAPRGSRAAKFTEIWGRDVKPIGRLGTGFNTFIDISKIEMWKSFKPMVSSNLMTKVEIAKHINNVMGTLNSQMLGVRQTQRQIEGGLLLFSPRFTRSAFAVSGQAMKGLTGGVAGAGQLEGLATRESIRAISGMIAGATFALGGIAMATGQWEEFKERGLDPFKSGWLTVEIGGQRVGVGGSTRALLDTVFKSAAAMAELDGGTASDLTKWNIFDPVHRAKNPIPNFWLNRTAPGVRELMLGSTFDGQGLDTPSEYALKGLAPKFLPFALQNYLSPGQGNARPSIVAGIPESVGLRGRPLSVSERRAAMRDELAKDAYSLNWDQLDVDQRNQVKSLDEGPGGTKQLALLDESVQAVESPTVGAYFADRQAITDMINAELSKSIQAFRQHKNGASLRGEYDRIIREGANSRRRLENSEEHKSAIDYLEENKQARMEGETLFNQLYDRYLDEVKDIDNYIDERTNLVDWDSKDVAEDDFRAGLIEEFGRKDGESMYVRMYNNYIGRDADGNPYNNSPNFPGEEEFWKLRAARETLNSVRYWQQAKDVIGNDPTMLMIWNTFEQSDPLGREALKREYRELGRIENKVARRRQLLRRRNPAVDKALVDYYGHRASNRENIVLERQQLRAAR